MKLAIEFASFFYLRLVSDLISILMPVKNAGPFLEECFTSILDQSYTNWELLAINDHSTDNSLSILNQFASHDNRINVFTNTGSGIIEALRTAYKHSAGRLITRMDADDTMPADKLKELSTALKQAGEGHLATGLVHYFSETELGNGYQRYANWLNTLTTSSKNYEDIYQECVIPSPCWMVYRTDLDHCGGFLPDRYPEDYDLCFRFYEAGLKVIGVSQELHHWRDHSVRASRTDAHYADNRFMDLKVHYFLKLEYTEGDTIVLIGAGKKGKQIARKFLEAGVAFCWVSNNINKIGKDIYGVRIETLESVLLKKRLKVLVAVTGPSDKEELQGELTAMGFIKGLHYWWLG